MRRAARSCASTKATPPASPAWRSSPTASASSPPLPTAHASGECRADFFSQGAEQIDAVIADKPCRELALTAYARGPWTVAISADGKRLLTCGPDDTTLRLWDAYTGKCLRAFEGHTEWAMGAALSPDGKSVLSA